MNPSQKTNLFESEKTLSAILFVVLAIWSFFSYHNWISDSEFWPISLSGHWDEWSTQPALLFKPLFHLSLSWIYLFKLNSVEHIKVAKAFYTFLGAASFFCFFQILKHHLNSQKALCLVLIFIFSHLGFSQIGLIRSDFLSYFAVLFFFLFQPKLNPTAWMKNALVAVGFSLILFLITPKSLFFGILILVFSFLKLNKQSRFRYVLAVGWLFIFAYFAVDLFVSNTVASRGLIATISFAEASYNSEKALPFFNPYLLNYLRNDVLLCLLILFGLSWQTVLILKKKISSEQIPWLAVGLLALFFITYHKPSLPFFVGSYWGVLFLSLIPLLDKVRLKYLVSVFCLTLLVLLIRFDYNYHFSNSVQLKTIQSLENYIGLIPNGKIFDGLAVVTRAPQDLYYVGPDDAQSNEQILTKVLKEKPELIVYTHRLNLIEPQLGRMLQAEYKPIGIGYWLRKDLGLEKELGELKPAFFVFGYYPNTKYLTN